MDGVVHDGHAHAGHADAHDKPQQQRRQQRRLEEEEIEEGQGVNGQYDDGLHYHMAIGMHGYAALFEMPVNSLLQRFEKDVLVFSCKSDSRSLFHVSKGDSVRKYDLHARERRISGEHDNVSIFTIAPQLAGFFRIHFDEKLRRYVL